MTDVNTTQVVAGSGATGQAAADTKGVTGQAAAAVKSDATDKGPVPYERFKEVNDRARAAETEAQTLKQQVQQISAQVRIMQANSPQAAGTQKPKTAVHQAIDALGFGDERILDKDQIATVFDYVFQQQNVMTQQQAFIAQHSDYEQVVGRSDPVTGQFVPSDALKKVLTANPALGSALTGPHAGMLAYELVKRDMAAEAAGTVAAKTKEAKAVIDAAASAISISNIAGTTSVDKAAQMKNMPPAEFQAHKEAIKSRAT